MAYQELRSIGRTGNVIAGTDCVFSQVTFNPMVHSSIMWAKFRSFVEGAALATGVYFYRLQAGEQKRSRKLLLLQ